MPAALKFYKACPDELVVRLNKCLEDLESNPFWGPDIKLLRGGKRRYRYRVGSYRVIYSIDKENKKVIITLVSLRSAAYREIS